MEQVGIASALLFVVIPYETLTLGNQFEEYLKISGN